MADASLLLKSDTKSALNRLPAQGVVAYFSMEIAIHPDIPTYSGGLGVLAGDTLRSMADLGLPAVAVTLLYRKGYFKQHLDATGVQTEEAQQWNPADYMVEEKLRTFGNVEGRHVELRAWRYDLVGRTGHIVPIYLLDADIEGNTDWDRDLTRHLYGGDSNYRLQQEMLLGIGGQRLLGALEYDVNVYHMNEGHAALLTVGLLENRVRLRGAPLRGATEEEIENVRQRSVFTTHTPVPAGHDRFALDLATRVLGKERVDMLTKLGGVEEEMLNMTNVALVFSRFANAVALKHGKVSREMFPQYPIESITNGVHATTWTSEPIQALLDEHAPRWREDNVAVRDMIDAPLDAVTAAHKASKHRLFAAIAERTGTKLNENLLTLGFARRAATYKRMDLLFNDTVRLSEIAKKAGGLQVVYAGKAHPQDEPGKALIRHVVELATKLSDGTLKVIFLENYDWHLGALLTSGVDVWLNTPRRPYEASGTSGMKAALNGVPSLSVLDGWWIEGIIEGATGWAIEDGASDEDEAASLYDKLEHGILPAYREPEKWAKISRAAIAFNGSYFNTQRMVEQYVAHAYYPLG